MMKCHQKCVFVSKHLDNKSIIHLESKEKCYIVFYVSVAYNPEVLHSKEDFQYSDIVKWKPGKLLVLYN